MYSYHPPLKFCWGTEIVTCWASALVQSARNQPLSIIQQITVVRDMTSLRNELATRHYATGPAVTQAHSGPLW